jgi:hypothetical protein
MKASDVRGLIEALEQLADETNCTLIATLHDRKGSGGPSISHFAGSAAWTQTPRVVMRLAHDPQSADRYVMCSEKCQVGPPPKSMYYTFDLGAGTPLFKIGEPCDLTVADVAGISIGTGERDALADARDFLTAELAEGEQRTKDLQLRAQDSGIAWATVRRAKESLRIVTARIPYSGTHYAVWRLPKTT